MPGASMPATVAITRVITAMRRSIIIHVDDAHIMNAVFLHCVQNDFLAFSRAAMPWCFKTWINSLFASPTQVVNAIKMGTYAAAMWSSIFVLITSFHPQAISQSTLITALVVGWIVLFTVIMLLFRWWRRGYLQAAVSHMAVLPTLTHEDGSTPRPCTV